MPNGQDRALQPTFKGSCLSLKKKVCTAVCVVAAVVTTSVGNGAVVDGACVDVEPEMLVGLGVVDTESQGPRTDTVKRALWHRFFAKSQLKQNVLIINETCVVSHIFRYKSIIII